MYLGGVVDDDVAVVVVGGGVACAAVCAVACAAACAVALAVARAVPHAVAYDVAYVAVEDIAPDDVVAVVIVAESGAVDSSNLDRSSVGGSHDHHSVPL